MSIELSERQKEIIDIVKAKEPITSKEIAEHIGLTRAALRPDLTILTMANILEAKPRMGYYFVQESDQLFRFAGLINTKIKELQSHPVVIQEDSSVYNAIVTLFLEDVGTLYVNDLDGYLVGVVSRKDLLKVTIGDADINQLPVSVVMSRLPVIVTYPDHTFYSAARKLVDFKIDALPVVVAEIISGKECLRVVGRFTKTNLAKTLVSYFSQL